MAISFCFYSISTDKLISSVAVLLRIQIYLLLIFKMFHQQLGRGGGPSSQAMGHFFFVEGDYCISFIYPSSPLVFSGVRDTRSLVLCVCFVDRCLSFYTFSFWPLCCLFFFDIWILITPLVSSNSSYST